MLSSTTYAILDWRKNNPKLKELISWLEILEIQRKDPPRLETKATEKSLNLKIKQKKKNWGEQPPMPCGNTLSQIMTSVIS